MNNNGRGKSGNRSYIIAAVVVVIVLVLIITETGKPNGIINAGHVSSFIILCGLSVWCLVPIAAVAAVILTFFIIKELFL